MVEEFGRKVSSRKSKRPTRCTDWEIDSFDRLLPIASGAAGTTVIPPKPRNSPSPHTEYRGRNRLVHHGPIDLLLANTVLETSMWSVFENNEELLLSKHFFARPCCTSPSEFVLGKFHSSSFFEKFVLCICLCNSNLSALTFLKSLFTHESQSELQVKHAS